MMAKDLVFVCDVEIDLKSGRLESIVIPGGNRLFGILGKDSEYIIPWERIKKIGEDIILVEIDERLI